MPSTVIRSFEYDEQSRTLLIVFQSGRRYRYMDVPAELVHHCAARLQRVGSSMPISGGDMLPTNNR